MKKILTSCSLLLVLLIAFSVQAEGAEVLMRTTVEDRGMSVGTEVDTVRVDTLLCDGAIWAFYDTVIATEGTYVVDYYDTLAERQTVAILTMAFREFNATNVLVTACDNYPWHDSVYTASTDSATYATWDRWFCDSVVTLHLTVNYGSHESLTEVACESFLWHDSTYTDSGVYQFDYVNSDGCASTDTLHLTINNSTTGTEIITSCDNYTWHDSTQRMNRHSPLPMQLAATASSRST